MTRSFLTSAGLMLLLGACSGTTDSTRDFGVDAGDLSAMKAGIWVDPNGCDHWIIDDGVEGYMTPRLDPNGKPKCRDLSEVDGNTIGFETKTVGDS